MRLGSGKIWGGVTATAAAWFVAAAIISGQAAPAAPAAQGEKPLLAEQVFKNVTVLRGLSVQEFMGAMGAFSAALGMSCEDCHNADDRNWIGFAAENPRKQMARRMVLMMQAINKTNFGGQQMVTCYSCHRGSYRPKVTPDLEEVYGGFPPGNPLDIIQQEKDAATPDAVFEKYLKAVGGQARAAALKSYTAKATRTGYGPEGFPVDAEIHAVAPNRLAVVVQTQSGVATTATDGTTAWYAAPYRPVPVLQLTGQDYEGVKIDAMLWFPAEIRNIATKWRVGRRDFVNEQEVEHVQGTTPQGVTVSLYFNAENGLLVRQERFNESPVGRIPTQVDYSDYREVAGVRVPHKIAMLGINGRETFDITALQPNTQVPASRFGRPAPPVTPPAR